MVKMSRGEGTEIDLERRQRVRQRGVTTKRKEEEERTVKREGRERKGVAWLRGGRWGGGGEGGVTRVKSGRLSNRTRGRGGVEEKESGGRGE